MPEVKGQHKVFRGQMFQHSLSLEEQKMFGKKGPRGRFARDCKNNKPQYEEGGEEDGSSDYEDNKRKISALAKPFKGMFQRKNEKNGIVCSICFTPEPPLCELFCTSVCNRYFHQECVKNVWANANSEPDELWKCPDCAADQFYCFVCHHQGILNISQKKDSFVMEDGTTP